MSISSLTPKLSSPLLEEKDTIPSHGHLPVYPPPHSHHDMYAQTNKLKRSQPTRTSSGPHRRLNPAVAIARRCCNVLLPLAAPLARLRLASPRIVIIVAVVPALTGVNSGWVRRLS